MTVVGFMVATLLAAGAWGAGLSANWQAALALAGIAAVLALGEMRA